MEYLQRLLRRLQGGDDADDETEIDEDPGPPQLEHVFERDQHGRLVRRPIRVDLPPPWDEFWEKVDYSDEEPGDEGDEPFSVRR